MSGGARPLANAVTVPVADERGPRASITPRSGLSPPSSMADRLLNSSFFVTLLTLLFTAWPFQLVRGAKGTCFPQGPGDERDEAAPELWETTVLRTCRSGELLSARDPGVQTGPPPPAEAPGHRCAGKRLMGGSPGKKSWFVAFASFHGVSLPITADSSSQPDITDADLGRAEQLVLPSWFSRAGFSTCP